LAGKARDKAPNLLAALFQLGADRLEVEVVKHFSRGPFRRR